MRALARWVGAFGLVFATMASARAALVITEVYVDTAIPSTEGDEFIEIANTGPGSVNLSNYAVGTNVTPGSNQSDVFLRFPNATMAPGDVVLVVKRGDEFLSTFPTVPAGVKVFTAANRTGTQIAMGTGVVGWSTGTTLALTNSSKQVILGHDSGGNVWVIDDGVSWGGSGATSVTPLGGTLTTFFDTPLSSSSMEGTTFTRKLATTDTNSISDWLRLQQPTPGTTSFTICGDGVVGVGETCDDGLLVAGDGCSASCQTECGYTCVGAGPGSCAADCGDGDVAGDEECDDGDNLPGDGCSPACQAEPGFVCETVPACDGNAGTLSTCDVDPCELPLRITELHVDGKVGNDSEWIELTNAGPIPIALQPWSITDGEGTMLFPSGAELAPNTTIILAYASEQYGTDFGLLADYEYGTDSDGAVPQLVGTAVALDDVADELRLVCGGSDRDGVRWAATPSTTHLPSNAQDYSASNPTVGPDTYTRVAPGVAGHLASDFVTSRCPSPGVALSPNHIPDAGPALLLAPSGTRTLYLPADDGTDTEPLTFTIDTTGTAGTVTLVSASSGEATYTVPGPQSGTTTFTYTVADACSTSPPIPVTVAYGTLACTDPDLVISEVHIDAAVDNQGEWIEIVNLGATTAQLSGVRLGDEESRGQPLGASEGMFYFPPGATIAPGAAVIVAFDGRAFEAAWGFVADYEWNHDASSAGDMLRAAMWSRGTTRLDEAGDEVVMYGCSGVLDAIYWGAASVQPYTDPPWASRLPSPPPYAGTAGQMPSSFARNDVDVDSDAPADFALDLCPSPGVAEPDNHSPVVPAGRAAVSGATYSGTLGATDPDGDDLVFALAPPSLSAAQGTVVLDDADAGTFTYTPPNGFVGIVTFGFSASDGCRVVTSTFTLCVGTTEIVGNATDEDCNGVALCYVDEDGDGFGVSATVGAGPSGCNGNGRAAVAGDCDDAPLGCGSACNPGANEICDGKDNDCSPATVDGSEDESIGDACDSPADANNCADDVFVCVPGTGLTCNNITTGDSGRVEVCDLGDMDEDCDGGADDLDPNGLPANATTFYRDQDNDGFGVTNQTVQACNRPTGYAAQSGDCADAPTGCGAACHPGVVESRAGGNCADGFDNDCDLLAADQDPECFADAVCYGDQDGDGFGAPGTSVTLEGATAGAGCGAYNDGTHPVGFWVANGTDCDDNPAACGAACYPGLADICDGKNNDCTSATADGSGDPTVGAACDSPDDGDKCTDELNVCVGGVVSCPNAPIGDAQRIETCDALDIDEDCDGGADDNDPQGTPPTGSRTVFQDRDGDGRGNASVTLTRCDVPTGYASQAGDCDDDPTPGHCGAACGPDKQESKAAGNCNDGFSNDCDSSVDTDPECFTDILCYLDRDRDGYGDPLNELIVSGPAAEAGCASFDDGTHAIGSWVANGTDCDDDPTKCGAACNPGRAEVCDGRDTDCNPATADGSGDPAIGQACDSPNDNDKCTDDRQQCLGNSIVCANIATNDSAQVERCDELHKDEDCDGGGDDDDPDGSPSTVTWYRDADEDGFGDPSTGEKRCVEPLGRVSNAGDCADDPGGCGAACHQGAAELCDGFDSDCRPDTVDGVDDPDVGIPCDSPADQDQCLDEISVCSGSVQCPNNPAGDLTRIEVCDADDNDEDCDGGGDDDDPQGSPSQGAAVFHRDADGDGHGDPAEFVSACDPGPGRTTTEDDCDDDPAACGANCFPGNTETGVACTDGYDNDCDLFTDTDPTCVSATTCYADADGDSYGVNDDTLGLPVGESGCATFDDGEHALGYWVAVGGDCAPDDDAIHPNAEEIVGNAIDEDCNGAYACWVDQDGDGVAADDAISADISPGVTCDVAFGFSDEKGDCDDDPDACGADCSPRLAEVCDERDNDCDDETDEIAGCTPVAEEEIILNGGNACASGTADTALGLVLAGLALLLARRKTV